MADPGHARPPSATLTARRVAYLDPSSIRDGPWSRDVPVWTGRAKATALRNLGLQSQAATARTPGAEDTMKVVAAWPRASIGSRDTAAKVAQACQTCQTMKVRVIADPGHPRPPSATSTARRAAYLDPSSIRDRPWSRDDAPVRIGRAGGAKAATTLRSLGLQSQAATARTPGAEDTMKVVAAWPRASIGSRNTAAKVVQTCQTWQTMKVRVIADPGHARPPSATSTARRAAYLDPLSIRDRRCRPRASADRQSKICDGDTQRRAPKSSSNGTDSRGKRQDEGGGRVAKSIDRIAQHRGQSRPNVPNVANDEGEGDRRSRTRPPSERDIDRTPSRVPGSAQHQRQALDSRRASADRQSWLSKAATARGLGLQSQAATARTPGAKATTKVVAAWPRASTLLRHWCVIFGTLYSLLHRSHQNRKLQ